MEAPIVMNSHRTFLLFVTVALLLALAIPAAAQESRGTISGTVTDAQKGVMPGVTVVVKNVDTNITRTLVSNAVGYYETPFLDPGTYTVSAEILGFKKYIRSGITLNVGMKITIDIVLEVGQRNEIVEVSAGAPLLDTTTASSGRVIDSKLIDSLPFSDLNPFALTGMASGMQWTGQPEYRRPFDNGGTSAFNASGGVGQNEYTIDGAPVTGTGRRVGYVPPADAIQEFNLQTTAFDASVGHTSGALVNVMSRTGTNAFHGALYDQHWQQRWNATQHFTRIAWENNVASGKISPDTPKQAPGRSNQFGATVGGPVRFPWIFNGKDKLFFFFSYNGIYQSKAETTDSINRTVPKMAWRNGDFSDLLAIDPVKYQIYDPRTARLVNGRVVRDPFVGNKGIPILNPIYKYYVNLYPQPNDVPGLVSPEGTNNYLASQMPKNEKFNSILNRIDWNLSDKHRINGKWYWNHRLADEYDWTYETARGLMANGLTRINKGGSGDYTWTINNANVFQVSLNYTRFNEGSQRDVPNKYKPSDVGFPTYLDQKAGDLHVLPRLNFENLEDISQEYATITIRGTTYEAKASMNTIWGKHSFKYGYSERRYVAATSGPGYTSGQYSFNNSYMRANDATTTASNIGLEWASFMMGLPSNGISIPNNDSAYWMNPYRALYFQDDWRLGRKLTLNLGLRYENEGGVTERYNRGIDEGFIADAKLPITDLVQASYATVYAANSNKGLLAPSDFKVTGGLPYLGQYNDAATDGTHRFLPRVGLAYQLTDKTVIRAGFGMYADTLNVNNSRPNQFGFSQDTSTTRTNDNGLTFCCGIGAAANLSATNNMFIDPFPVRADGTRFDTPLRDSLGLMSRVGADWNNNDYSLWRSFKPALQQRWRLGIQRQFRSDIVIEGSYSGAWSTLPTVNGANRMRINYLPQQYWATGNVRNQAVDDDMNTNITNPFNIKNLTALQSSNAQLYKYLSTVGFFTGGTLRKHQLLRPYPQYGTLTGLRPGLDESKGYGRVRYNDFEIRAEKRFSKGFSSTFSYTRVFKSNVKDWLANEFDTEMTWRPNNNTRPNRFVWDAVLDLPFGKGRRWLQSGLLNHIVGGWEASYIWQQQTGPATGDWGNRFFYGDINQLESLANSNGNIPGTNIDWHNDMHYLFNPNIVYRTGKDPIPSGFVGFEGRSAFQPGSYNVRVFPIRTDAIREPGIVNWDIKVMRKFRIREQMATAFSVDFLNAFNHTNLSGPNIDPTSGNFGKLTAQRGLSRIIQFNLRFVF